VVYRSARRVVLLKDFTISVILYNIRVILIELIYVVLL
jgi:hypothetical protein